MSRCKHFLYTYLYWTSTIYTSQKSIDWPWKRVQNPFHIFLRLAFGTLQGPYLPSHVHIYDLCCVWAFLWPWLEQQAESSVADQEFKELFLSRGTWKNFVFNCIFSRAMRFPILKRVLMVSLTVHLWFHFTKKPYRVSQQVRFWEIEGVQNVAFSSQTQLCSPPPIFSGL